MTNLPSGTVTFLFTDIEGSTKLAQVFSMAWRVSTLPLVSQIRKLLAPFCPQDCFACRPESKREVYGIMRHSVNTPTISPDRRSLYPAYHPILHID